MGSAVAPVARSHIAKHAEQGPAVCLRCPQVTTMIPSAQGPLQSIAVPTEPRTDDIALR